MYVSHCSMNSKGKRKRKKLLFSEQLLCASLVLENEFFRPQIACPLCSQSREGFQLNEGEEPNL